MKYPENHFKIKKGISFCIRSLGNKCLYKESIKVNQLIQRHVMPSVDEENRIGQSSCRQKSGTFSAVVCIMAFLTVFVTGCSARADGKSSTYLSQNESTAEISGQASSDEVLPAEEGLHSTFKDVTNQPEQVEQNLSDEKISPSDKKQLQSGRTHDGFASRGIKMLRNLYDNYVFGNRDFSRIAREICSESLLKRLADAYDYDCEDGNCYAVWLFRTSYQDGPEDQSKVNSIVAKGHGWFEVSYSDMGQEGKTSLKLTEHQGKLLIDEIRPDKSYSINTSEN